MYLIWLFLLLWFLSLFLLLLIFCCFFSPPPRELALEKENYRKNKSLILFASRGSLRKCPFITPCVFFSLVNFLCPQNMFVWFSRNMFWGSKGLFVASFLCCHCVVLMLGQEPSFGPTFLLCLHSLDWLSFLFVLFFFCCPACLLCFSMGSGLLRFNYLRHLRIVFSSLLCPHAASSTSCLGPSFCVWGRGLPFCGDRLRESFGDGHKGGVNIFSVFLIIGALEWKQALPSRARVLMTVSLLQNTASLGSKKTTVFNCFSANTTKRGVSEAHMCQRSVIHP